MYSARKGPRSTNHLSLHLCPQKLRLRDSGPIRTVVEERIFGRERIEFNEQNIHDFVEELTLSTDRIVFKLLSSGCHGLCRTTALCLVPRKRSFLNNTQRALPFRMFRGKTEVKRTGKEKIRKDRQVAFLFEAQGKLRRKGSSHTFLAAEIQGRSDLFTPTLHRPPPLTR